VTQSSITPPTSPLSVAILGATGAVGQRFIQQLEKHPWFKITRLFASPRSAGKPYGEAVNWVLDRPLSADLAQLQVEALPLAGEGLGETRIAFSALTADLAGEVETQLAASGVHVFSNASSHRMDSLVPLVVPEVNPDHLELVPEAARQGGSIITNPNCSTIGLVMALGPLLRNYGIRRVSVVTEQALSGAGLVDGGFMKLENNVLPLVSGEEEKLATETGKLLGTLEDTPEGLRVRHARFPVSATCTRVPVRDGHLICVSVELEQAATREELLQTWSEFRASAQELKLPSAPAHPLIVLDAPDAPQPALHCDLEGGMAASIGRLRPDTLFGEPAKSTKRRGWKFITLSHNTVRGAAGGSVLNAELWLASGGLSNGKGDPKRSSASR
jgi:aspartate-semialdehyde dehydrogenase